MRFSKWHGLGNDYLLIERAEAGAPLEARVVQRLCDYHFGIGSDGILEVTSVSGASMDVVIWNPDGSTAELSGNGTRIAARWLARETGRDEVRVTVGPREVTATMRGGLQVETRMGRVEVGDPEKLEVDGLALEFTPVSVGNPHAVIRRDPERAELLRLGPLVENHPRFPRADERAARTYRLSERRDCRRLGEGGRGDALLRHERLCRRRRGGGAGLVRQPCHRSPRGRRAPRRAGRTDASSLTGPAQEICMGTVAAELLEELGA